MKIAIVAGEASGDRLAAGLIRALQKVRSDIDFEGIAGPEMLAAGCRALGSADELAVMGITDVVRHLPRLLGLRRRLAGHWRERPPAIFVGVDAPDFNLGLAARLRDEGVTTVQYVCPSVWAWRQGRVKNTATCGGSRLVPVAVRARLSRRQ